MISPRERLIVALDVSSSTEAQKIVACLADSVQTYKVGMQLYTAEGPQVVRDLVATGKKVFLDLKYHDIPNTVAAAVREAAQLGVSMLTVHACGGTKMLRAAAEAAQGKSSGLQVLAVTVLTSMDEQDLAATGVPGQVVDQVVRLASMALKAGCAGVVSSAQEVRTLRAKLSGDFLAVTPGVRPAGSAHGDQARVVTPAEANAAGATHIVVGRPITAAANPALEAGKILREMQVNSAEFKVPGR
jgi:orotidine-5'-phosphate decarboxylase